MTKYNQLAIQWEFIISKIKSSVTVVDATLPDFPLMYVNEYFSELTGYSAEESIGQNCRFLQGPDTDPETVQKIREALKKRQSIKTEILNYTKHGQKFWNELNIDPIFDDSGECLFFVGIQYDISERKYAEQQLRMAASLTEMNSRGQLEFIGKLNHELRTPLNGIMGMIELVGMGDNSEEQKEYLELARQSGEALLNIVNNSLDMAKLGRGKMRVEQIEFQPLKLIQQIIKTHEPAAQNKQIRLLCYADLTTPDVLTGDPLRLRQVLDNLLSNAIKFTEQGEVQLQMDVEERRGDTVILVFTVHDTGIGIPDNKINQLFEAFTQTDISHARKFGGSGLGLTICKELLELMDGQISVESTEGKGTKFEVTLPLLRQQAIPNVG
ncbi:MULTISPECIES: sensor histidine kinase [unclassified Paenibacillus]|uniref:sensor histidine kinase n=1 Tax=unclassified Paenibacillus TaxID=185978 RepID=UPI0009A7B27A|nr:MULTISPECIES: ATP-binding protein [unclassified Paenibacillus]SLK10928.1 PAS domain S-box-containing protein [Paenibacillus sp. RU5A]SOC72114.1 PAS domain S-box-containing protein [Paenibacillus sp. RU26A]SOC74457.1 PAS domain S-box-containing protein [Paenibacillus sp. RU5M]